MTALEIKTCKLEKTCITYPTPLATNSPKQTRNKTATLLRKKEMRL